VFLTLCITAQVFIRVRVCIPEWQANETVNSILYLYYWRRTVCDVLVGGPAPILRIEALHHTHTEEK
jgi:nitric oxide reductase large subunit